MGEIQTGDHFVDGDGQWSPRLTVPRGTSRADMERLLEEKRLWIVGQRLRQVPRLCLDPRPG